MSSCNWAVTVYIWSMKSSRVNSPLPLLSWITVVQITTHIFRQYFWRKHWKTHVHLDYYSTSSDTIPATWRRCAASAGWFLSRYHKIFSNFPHPKWSDLQWTVICGMSGSINLSVSPSITFIILSKKIRGIIFCWMMFAICYAICT